MDNQGTTMAVGAATMNNFASTVGESRGLPLIAPELKT
jgi:hypothetical protein